MIRRLWHFWVVGHRWRIRWAYFNPGVAASGYVFGGVHNENDRRRFWGFTEIALGCDDCGAFKRKRLIGNHVGIKDADELAELERLAKLK